ncbi:MAG: hypothetical protein H5U40_11790 [Polyangiaceae bacterium]|nr:hypothetical protein [Polyangiaceae bacterium]
MKKSPLAVVKERFGADRKEAKQKLVAAVRDLTKNEAWVEKLSEKGLEHVSNKKLLHLESVLTTVAKEVGGRTGLIDAILKLEKREKDAGYRSRLDAHPTPRLWDQYRSIKKSAAA